jgi:hypothetical protein
MSDPVPQVAHLQRSARLILSAFLLIFISARILVYMIMDGLLPDFYLHVGGTHVHHLNYGIFLLSADGAYLLLARPMGRALTTATIVYGVGLALTFDEFGMWLHLGGAYWQRASFDAVVVIASVLGLIAVAPSLRRMTTGQWIVLGALGAALVAFAGLFAQSLEHAGERLTIKLQTIEAESPR